ncbi:hypothetical protein Hamer_G023214 [Homarus americanus]|uniref:Uncharacterized protein n=1 Tax=Homarus americanus TaxID=6706 RepID=A0A8J5JTZ5_HOMAM|nr:hypothetical protein Hamer_G023214 [Homarus americanus]
MSRGRPTRCVAPGGRGGHCPEALKHPQHSSCRSVHPVSSGRVNFISQDRPHYTTVHTGRRSAGLLGICLHGLSQAAHRQFIHGPHLSREGSCTGPYRP